MTRWTNPQVCRLTRASPCRVFLPVIASLAYAGALIGGDGTLPYAFEKVDAEYRLSLGLTNAYYYGFLYTPDLLQPFSILKMALGNPAPTFGYTPGSAEAEGFFRAEALDAFAPQDTDGDGIDDIWELKNRLNPLNPADARLRNAIDPTKTNLQYYQNRYKLTIAKDFYSLEVSIDNKISGVSEEVSLYNLLPAAGLTVNTQSDEVSLYNFTQVTGVSAESLSDEVSVYNASAVNATNFQVALSDEVSLFNAPISITPSLEALSDEVSLFNQPASAFASIEAISLEVSVQNSVVGTTYSLEAISDEVSLFNTASSALPMLEAVSDEISAFNTPLSLLPSVQALSDEVSLFNAPGFTGPSVDAVSDEVSIFNQTQSSLASVQAFSDEVSVFNAYGSGVDAPIVSQEVSVLNTIQ